MIRYLPPLILGVILMVVVGLHSPSPQAPPPSPHWLAANLTTPANPTPLQTLLNVLDGALGVTSGRSIPQVTDIPAQPDRTWCEQALMRECTNHPQDQDLPARQAWCQQASQKCSTEHLGLFGALPVLPTNTAPPLTIPTPPDLDWCNQNYLYCTGSLVWQGNQAHQNWCIEYFGKCNPLFASSGNAGRIATVSPGQTLEEACKALENPGRTSVSCVEPAGENDGACTGAHPSASTLPVAYGPNRAQGYCNGVDSIACRDADGQILTDTCVTTPGGAAISCTDKPDDFVDELFARCSQPEDISVCNEDLEVAHDLTLTVKTIKTLRREFQAPISPVTDPTDPVISIIKQPHRSVVVALLSSSLFISGDTRFLFYEFENPALIEKVIWGGCCRGVGYSHHYIIFDENGELVNNSYQHGTTQSFAVDLTTKPGGGIRGKYIIAPKNTIITAIVEEIETEVLTKPMMIKNDTINAWGSLQQLLTELGYGATPSAPTSHIPPAGTNPPPGSGNITIRSSEHIDTQIQVTISTNNSEIELGLGAIDSGAFATTDLSEEVMGCKDTDRNGVCDDELSECPAVTPPTPPAVQELQISTHTTPTVQAVTLAVDEKLQLNTDCSTCRIGSQTDVEGNPISSHLGASAAFLALVPLVDVNTGASSYTIVHQGAVQHTDLYTPQETKLFVGITPTLVLGTTSQYRLRAVTSSGIEFPTATPVLLRPNITQVPENGTQYQVLFWAKDSQGKLHFTIQEVLLTAKPSTPLSKTLQECSQLLATAFSGTPTAPLQNLNTVQQVLNTLAICME